VAPVVAERAVALPFDPQGVLTLSGAFVDGAASFLKTEMLEPAVFSD
jgi:hypothetical protein